MEILVFMGIFAIAAGVFTDVLSSSLNLRNETDAVSAVQQDGNFIITRLTYDIARASSVSTPTSPGDTSSTMQLTIAGTPYTYALNGTTIQLTANGSTDDLSSPGTQVSGLTFTRLGSGAKDTIRLQFTVSSTTVKGSATRETKTYATTVGLR